MADVKFSERRVALVIARWLLGFASVMTLVGLLWPWIAQVEAAPLPPEGIVASLAWWVLSTRNVMLMVGAMLVFSSFVAFLFTTLAAYGPRFAEGMLARLAGLGGVLPSLMIVGLWRVGEPEPGALSLVVILSLLQGLSVAQSLLDEGRRLDQLSHAGAVGQPGVFRRRAFAFGMLPKLRSLIAGRLALVTASVTEIEAGLSFIGLGLREVPTWGGLLGVAARSHTADWLSVLFALTSAVSLVLAVSVVTGRAPQVEPVFELR